VSESLTWDRYATAWASRHGGYDPRHASTAVRAWLWMSYGLGRIMVRRQVTPMTLMVTGVILNVLAVPMAWLAGPLPTAVLVIAGAVAVGVDGAVAVLTSRTAKLGYLYDALVARVAELCWLATFWAVGAPVALLVFCGGVAWLHEYVRAKGVAIGLTAVGSISVGEHSARLTVTVAGLVLAGLTSYVLGGMAAGTVTIAGVVWLFLGVFGLVQLLGGIRKSFG